MQTICLYFQAHQPHRLRSFSPFDIGKNKDPFDHQLNAGILHRVSERCYLPTNQLLLDLIHRFEGRFKIAFSLSGCLLDQLAEIRPDVIDSFRRLAASGCVEFLGETDQHSLASIMDWDEFEWEVREHSRKIFRLLGQIPLVFRNTELIYSNELAERVEKLGFRGVIAEGLEKLTQSGGSHQLYHSATPSPLPVILRDFQRSDDIAFRFNDRKWEHYPLEPQRFQGWIEESGGGTCNIFMDYETFGEHQDQSNGLFHFFAKWVASSIDKNTFLTPSELIKSQPIMAVYHVPKWISWADSERDLSAWQGNSMQKEALLRAFLLKDRVEDRPKLLARWRRLLQSDHFYYMATKEGPDGEVHEYFSPFATPHDAYLRFMNVIADLEQNSFPN